MENNKQELKPLYDSRKSFYKKAFVIYGDNNIKLLSYQTIVCSIENDKPKILGLYSVTTTRHIKEFLKQKGFKAETTQQLLKDYL